MTNWTQKAQSVRWNIEPFIGGRYRPSASRDILSTVNPASEAVLAQASAGDAADVDAAVEIARRRFDDGCWSGMPPVARIEVLLKLAELIVAHKDELALLDTLEMGKPISASLWDAEVFAPAVLRSAAGFADKLFGESVPLSADGLWINTYQPRGVIGAITPWNFPLVNTAFKIAPALAAGNVIVLKPSEIAPSSTLRLAELALEAGLPEGVLNVVPGLGATVGAALAGHSDVDLLSFTGSTTTGRRIMELAGRSNGKPLLLECGGKSPQLVFADANNLEVIADGVVQSFLWNQGQVCSARTRLIVEESVADALVALVVERARRYQPGNPLDSATDFGPLASAGQRDRVSAYVEQGLAEGAEAALKGAIRESGGCYVAPTVFDKVTPAMRVAREEIFGPVLCVQRFVSEEEALALANGTDYGLDATIWTRDLGRAKRMAHGVKAGSITIRTSGKEGPPSGCQLSHEPQKRSGFGAELGLKGLQSYSTLKSVSFVGG